MNRNILTMGKNDIFNANLLQLPLKAQVADEGVVQDTAPVAEPTAPAMGEGLCWICWPRTEECSGG